MKTTKPRTPEINKMISTRQREYKTNIRSVIQRTDLQIYERGKLKVTS